MVHWSLFRSLAYAAFNEPTFVPDSITNVSFNQTPQNGPHTWYVGAIARRDSTSTA